MKNKKFTAIFLVYFAISGCSKILTTAETKSNSKNFIESFLKNSDKVIMNKTLQNALENFALNKVANWRNSHTGNSGSIIITKTIKIGIDNYCREYTQTAIIDGKNHQFHNKACRTSRANWKEVY